ncbi:hypothetical protein EDB81DRAFT_780352 [Dactylonectria macrodidyma]|uniref:C2H2-type domain-containing protein n=1 Tax=Dactylonectria macrodidyma TaxID=307937 RepID=A0A9P9FML9_9HYPO|nr:hypothetical protein EDB81DRAFT_780352 [Dactylonectria macrodidyma]
MGSSPSPFEDYINSPPPSPTPLDDYINAPQELPDKWAKCGRDDHGDSIPFRTTGGGSQTEVVNHPATVSQFESTKQESINRKGLEARLSARVPIEPHERNRTAKTSQLPENFQANAPASGRNEASGSIPSHVQILEAHSQSRNCEYEDWLSDPKASINVTEQQSRASANAPKCLDFVVTNSGLDQPPTGNEGGLSDQLGPLCTEPGPAITSGPLSGAKRDHLQRNHFDNNSNLDETFGRDAGSFSTAHSHPSNSGTTFSNTMNKSQGETCSLNSGLIINRLMLSQSSHSRSFASDTVSSNSRVTKRDRGESDNGKNQGKESENGERCQQKRRREGVNSLMFACLFLKHKPELFGHPKWKSCWPGWPTFHRLREHLYRRHLLPRYQCNRCCQDLKSPAGLSQHQRLLVPCQIQHQEPQEGINEEKERNLRTRKYYKGKVSDEEKWIELYKTLFPNDGFVPLPYQSPMSIEQVCNDHQDDTSTLDRFEEYSLAEFQKRVRFQIEGLADRTHEQTEALTHISVNVLQGLFETFRQRLSRGDLSLNAAKRVGLEQEALRGISTQLGSTSIPLGHDMQEGTSESGLVLVGGLVEDTPGQPDVDYGQFLEGNPVSVNSEFEEILASLGTQE